MHLAFLVVHQYILPAISYKNIYAFFLKKIAKHSESFIYLQIINWTRNCAYLLPSWIVAGCPLGRFDT